MSHRTQYFLAALALFVMSLSLGHSQWQLYSREDRLQAGGVETHATLKNIEVSRYGAFVHVEFAAKGQSPATRKVMADRGYVEDLRKSGAPPALTVRYLPEDPDEAEIVGASPANVWGLAFTAGIMAVAGWVLRRGLRTEA